MKSTIKSKFFKVLVLLISFMFVAFNMPQQKPVKPWEIPAKFKNMKNPIPGEEISVGQSIYRKHCRSCHGNEGLGDGPKAKKLETNCGDFSSTAFQAQSDGVIYYQSFIGRDEMPNYEKKITDADDRWAVVNFIRTLKN